MSPLVFMISSMKYTWVLSTPSDRCTGSRWHDRNAFRSTQLQLRFLWWGDVTLPIHSKLALQKHLPISRISGIPWPSSGAIEEEVVRFNIPAAAWRRSDYHHGCVNQYVQRRSWSLEVWHLSAIERSSWLTRNLLASSLNVAGRLLCLVHIFLHQEGSWSGGERQSCSKDYHHAAIVKPVSFRDLGLPRHLVAIALFLSLSAFIQISMSIERSFLLRKTELLRLSSREVPCRAHDR